MKYVCDVCGWVYDENEGCPEAGIAPGTSQAGGIAFTQDSTPEEEVTTAVEIADPPILPGKLKAEDVAKETASIAREIESEKQEEKPVYEFPPLELLKIEAQSIADSRGEVSMNRERLESTIHSFGVNANICGVTRGPTVTRYDLELEAGVKLNKLTNLSNDLALSLGVSSVRIAPIPDKISTVGKKPEAPKAPTTKKCPYCLSEIPIEATKCAHCTSELK